MVSPGIMLIVLFLPILVFTWFFFQPKHMSDWIKGILACYGGYYIFHLLLELIAGVNL
jgi:hypothetical protein